MASFDSAHMKLTAFNISFYPTAFKGCVGIVFIHGVRMGFLAGS